MQQLNLIQLKRLVQVAQASTLPTLLLAWRALLKIFCLSAKSDHVAAITTITCGTRFSLAFPLYRRQPIKRGTVLHEKQEKTSVLYSTNSDYFRHIDNSIILRCSVSSLTACPQSKSFPFFSFPLSTALSAVFLVCFSTARWVAHMRPNILSHTMATISVYPAIQSLAVAA